MSQDVYLRLGLIMLTIALGAALAKSKLMRRPTAPGGSGSPGKMGADPAFAMAQLATYVLLPALLFRTVAKLDTSHMPWPVIQGFFVPALLCSALVYAAHCKWLAPSAGAEQPAPAAAATRTMATMYGNSVQLGIPLASAMFGEGGLLMHIALVSLHGLIVLTFITLLAEYDVARARGGMSLVATLGQMLRNALVHPVVLPVLLGLAFRLTGLPLPELVDQVLAFLGWVAIPLCLLLIGIHLVQFGSRTLFRPVLPQVLFKLLVFPAAVLLVAYALFGLRELPLKVAVMMAALPVGNNALIFAQRYRILQGEASAAVVLSTLAFAATAPLWLLVLNRLASG